MQKGLIPILLLTFVNILNFAIMIPVLPFIVEQYGGGSLMYGILLSMYPLFQFFAAPILGAWSDLQGRRPVLLISQAGTLLSWVIFAIAYFVPNISIGSFALPLIVIMIARIADGVTGGNNSVANAYLTDITKPEERAKRFGMLGGIVGLGLIIGPAIGGYTSSLGIGYLGTALANIALSTVTLILMWYFLPETLSRSERDESLHFKWTDEIQFITKLKKYSENRILKYLFFIRVFFLLSFNAYTSIIVLFMIESYKLEQSQLGLLFLVTGSYMIINQMFVSPFFARKLGVLKTFVIGLALFIFSLITLEFASNVWLFLLNAYFLNVGISMAFPTFKSLLSHNVEQRKQGEIQGIDEAFLAASAAIAPITAGFIYQYVGKYSFGVFAIGLLIPLFYFVTRYKKKPND